MSETRVGKRYSQALFELSDGSDAKLDEYLSLLQGLAALFDDENIGKVLHSPVVPATTKGEILQEVVADKGLDKLLASFLETVADAGRVAALPAIADNFEILLNEKRGIIKGEVVSVFALDDQQMSSLRQQLEDLVKKKVLLTNTIDSSILGGFRVSLGTRVLDMSLRSKLNAITSAAAL